MFVCFNYDMNCQYLLLTHLHPTNKKGQRLFYLKCNNFTPYKTDNHLIAYFLRQPVSACTRTVKPSSILIKQEMIEWQWHQLDHKQIICKLLPPDNQYNHASILTQFLTGQMLFLMPNQQCQSTVKAIGRCDLATTILQSHTLHVTNMLLKSRSHICSPRLPVFPCSYH